jgi:hypothetical protein
MGLFQWYLKRLGSHPLSTNALSSGVIAGTGDMLCQTYQKWDLPPVAVEERKWYNRGDLWGAGGNVDIRRSAIQLSYGTFIVTPIFLRLFKTLDKHIPQVTMANALKKGLSTWTTVTLCISPCFFMYATVFSNLFLHHDKCKDFTMVDHWNAAKDKVVADWAMTAQISFCFWSPHWIPLFYYLPPQYRLLYNSIMNVAWQAIMSGILHRKVAGAAADDAMSTGGVGVTGDVAPSSRMQLQVQ